MKVGLSINSINVGDKVALKSGSPSFVVNEAKELMSGKVTLQLIWWNEENQNIGCTWVNVESVIKVP